MKKKPKVSLPISLLVLDIIGTLLLALGLYALFGGRLGLFSEIGDSRQLAIALIIAGGLMMLPLVVMIVRRATNR